MEEVEYEPYDPASPLWRPEDDGKRETKQYDPSESLIAAGNTPKRVDPCCEEESNFLKQDDFEFGFMSEDRKRDMKRRQSSSEPVRKSKGQQHRSKRQRSHQQHPHDSYHQQHSREYQQHPRDQRPHDQQHPRDQRQYQQRPRDSYQQYSRDSRNEHTRNYHHDYEAEKIARLVKTHMQPLWEFLVRWKQAGCPSLPASNWMVELWTAVAYVAPFYPSWPLTAQSSWADPSMTQTLQLAAAHSSNH